MYTPFSYLHHSKVQVVVSAFESGTPSKCGYKNIILTYFAFFVFVNLLFQLAYANFMQYTKVL